MVWILQNMRNYFFDVSKQNWTGYNFSTLSQRCCVTNFCIWWRYISKTSPAATLARCQENYTFLHGWLVVLRGISVQSFSFQALPYREYVAILQQIVQNKSTKTKFWIEGHFGMNRKKVLLPIDAELNALQEQDRTSRGPLRDSELFCQSRRFEKLRAAIILARCQKNSKIFTGLLGNVHRYMCGKFQVLVCTCFRESSA